MTQSPQHEDFKPHLDKVFRFEGRPQVLRLATIDIHHPPSWPAEHRKPFTLIFHGARADLLPEGLYVAEIEGGAHFDLYIIPIHTDSTERQDYQAAFN